MSLLTVLHFPDPRLRKQARPVTTVDTSIRNLADDMLETMYAERGIGLAGLLAVVGAGLRLGVLVRLCRHALEVRHVRLHRFLVGDR